MKNTANISAAAQPGTKIVLLSPPIAETEREGKEDGQKSGAAVILLLPFWIKDRKK